MTVHSRCRAFPSHLRRPSSALRAARRPEAILRLAAVALALAVPSLGQSFAYRHGGVGFGCEVASDQKAWFAFEGGVIRYTTDGGSTIHNAVVPTNVRGTLRAFHMAQDAAGPWGYCVGNDGVVLRSVDDGLTWTQLPVIVTPPNHLKHPNLAPELWDVWFENRLHGYVVGFENTVVETFDGGLTWIDISAPGHVQSANPKWYRLHVFAPGEFVTTGDFGWVMRLNADGSKAAFRILESWWCYLPQLPVPQPFDLQLYGLDFVGDVGFAVGGVGNNDGYVFRSQDRGQTWALDTSCFQHLSAAPGTTPPTFYGFDLFGDVARGVAVGYGSGCYLGGVSSTASGPSDCPNCPPSGKAWLQTVCDSEQNGVADPFDDTAQPLLRDVAAAPSLEVGFAIGDFGVVRRSDDQGTSWVELAGLHRGRLQCAAFADPLVGVAGGQLWRIYSTADGGEAWSLDYVASGAPSNIGSGEFRGAAIAENGARAVICGDRGRVAVRDNNGTWSDRSVGGWLDGPALTSALTVGDGTVMLVAGARYAGNHLHLSVDGGASFTSHALKYLGVTVPAKVADMAFDGRYVYYLTTNQRVYVADSLGGFDQAIGFVTLAQVLPGSQPTCIGARGLDDFYVGNDRGQLFRIDLPSLTMRPVAAVAPGDLGEWVFDCEPVPGTGEWFFTGAAGRVVRFDGVGYSHPKSAIADNVVEAEFFGGGAGLLIGRKSNVAVW